MESIPYSVQRKNKGISSFILLYGIVRDISRLISLATITKFDQDSVPFMTFVFIYQYLHYKAEAEEYVCLFECA